MNRKRDGFTLIEIIVSIAIASIVLMLISSLMLSSFKLLLTTSERDIDKQSVDYVIDFVRSEIQYSSDVRIATTEPSSTDEKDEWHSLYVKDHVLYRDDKQVYSEDFYSGRELSIKAKCNYGSSERIDLYYTLVDNKEVVYSSRDTVMLLNLIVSEEIKDQGLYIQEEVSLNNSEGNEYKLYYNKKMTNNSVVKPSLDFSGTVEDIADNLYWGNCKGLYDSKETYTYDNGEIVWHKGYWWQNISYTDNSEPGVGYGWKRLDQNYAHIQSAEGVNKICSGYEKNDIVIYEEKFYQAQNNLLNVSATDIRDEWNSGWTELGSIHDPAVVESVSRHTYIKKEIYKPNNVVDKYLDDMTILKDPSRMQIPIYSETKNYKIGDIVRVQNSLDSSNKYFDLYIKQINVIGNTSPGSFSSGWVKIDIRFDGNRSSYVKGDIVRLSSDSLPWIVAQKDILFQTNPGNDIYQPSGDIWQRLN